MIPLYEGDPVKLQEQLLQLQHEDPDALERIAQQVKDLRISLARENPIDFIEYVMRDEESQEPLKLAPYHRKLMGTLEVSRNVVIWGHVELGKTQLISIGRAMWEIGKNPSIRICVIQGTETNAEAIVSTIKRYIEDSKEYHEVFPHVKRGDVWTSNTINVDRPITIKDPTLMAAGVHGNVLGRRFDLVIIDDAVTGDNTATEYMRDDIFNWIQSTPMSRLTRQARIWVLGNAWHRADAMHRFAGMAGWKSFKFPLRDPVTKRSLWPERFNEAHIQHKVDTLMEWEVARSLDCIPRTEEAGRFRQQWFDDSIERGRGLFGEDTMCYGLAKLPPGCETFTGVDLGISEALGTDLSAIFTVMLSPDGLVTVMNLQTGNWDANEIVERIVRTQAQFKSWVFVESVFAQRWILQLVRKRAPNCPVFPFQTRGSGTMRNKRHTFFGVEAVAAELAQNLWLIPCAKTTGKVDPEIKNWITGCMNYDPDSHTADALMASWIALQGARKQTGITGYAGAVDHNPYVTLETTPLTDEERQEHRKQEDYLFRQKQQEGFWEVMRGDLDLPIRTEEELAEDLGLTMGR